MRLISSNYNTINGLGGEIEYFAVTDAFFGTPGTWTYRKDNQTGHLWLDPQPAPECIPELYETYYTHTESPTGGQSSWKRATDYALHKSLGYPEPKGLRLREKLLSLAPSVTDAALMETLYIPASATGTILDFGCGSGRFLVRMKAAGWSPIGMEPDPNAAANLRHELGFPVYESLDDLERQQLRFDRIVLSHVIEHLSDPIDTIARLGNMLSSDGQLIVTTPNAESLGSRWFRTHWRGLEPPRHFNVFTSASLKQAMIRAGLVVDEISTHSRLARGIFYLSVLSRLGHRELESQRPAQRRWLTYCGYLFQMLQAAIIRIRPRSGEEIFCTARSLRTVGIGPPD
jgi:SAM-dependent methyltransferase